MMSQLDIMWVSIGLTGIIWCAAEWIRFLFGITDLCPTRVLRKGWLPFLVKPVVLNEEWMARIESDTLVTEGQIVDGKIVWGRPAYAEKLAAHIKQRTSGL